MTTITTNAKTARVIVEEDGYSPYYGALISGATAIKVSVSKAEYDAIIKRTAAWVGSREYWEALRACKSCHVIRKARTIL